MLSREHVMAVDRMARRATQALKFFTKDADGRYGALQLEQYTKMRALDVTHEGVVRRRKKS